MTISMKQLTLLAETYNFDENEARILLGLPSKVRVKQEKDKPKQDKPKQDKPKREDKPKGPTAYHTFIKANKEVVKNENFGMTAREVHNECIAKWKSLSEEEKEAYRTIAITKVSTP